MNILNKKFNGFMNEIRCDEPSYLIWKWHPASSHQGTNNRENAIRWGSSLRVKDGEAAVFVYKQKNNATEDFIVGPFDEAIKTNNLPIIANIIGLAYDRGTPFQAEIYFVNLAQIIQVNFGVPFFDVFDPRFTDFGVPIAVRGTISFKISDCKKFIKLHRLNSFDLEDFQNQIRNAVIRYVKDTITNAPAENDISVIQIESKIAQITDVIEYNIGERLYDNFGVTVSGVDIGAIEIDRTSDGYTQLMVISRDVTSATIKAKTEASIKNIHDMQRVDIENYQEVLRVQREEGQYAQHKGTQTSNFAAFQTEAQTQVGIAGADALGKMSASGAGDVDLGNGNTGFNPAAMMASMAVGSAVGQNIASSMNGIMSGANMHFDTRTVPPIPSTISSYFVAVNDKPIGPFSISDLYIMSISGDLLKDSLVWKQGMLEWTSAGAVQELDSLFKNLTPPILPSR